MELIDYARKVKAMRDAQRLYFSEAKANSYEKYNTLKLAKRLESEIDKDTTVIINDYAIAKSRDEQKTLGI